MIVVHRLNGTEIIINTDLVEIIEATPDTTITFTTGKILIVQDSINDIRNRIIEYKKRLYSNEY